MKIKEMENVKINNYLCNGGYGRINININEIL